LDARDVEQRALGVLTPIALFADRWPAVTGAIHRPALFSGLKLLSASHAVRIKLFIKLVLPPRASALLSRCWSGELSSTTDYIITTRFDPPRQWRSASY